MITFDSKTVDSAGAFLVGELERLDKQLHMPLVQVTWNRDIDLREDVTIADEASSFTNTSLAAMGSLSPGGKNWVGPKANALAGISLDTNKTAQNMNLWAMQLGWTIQELAKASILGRPIDSQQTEALRLKHNMDVDEQVYIGDEDLGLTGLVNNANITPEGLAAEWDETTTAKQMLSDVNDILSQAYARSGYTLCPDRMLIPPTKLGLLTQPVSDAGSISILKYVAENCLCNSINGRPLQILPLKWLVGRGTSGKNRVVTYTKNKTYVRFPMVPLQRTPVEFRGLHQLTTYFGTIGSVEFVYPETVSYADGL
ncbi:DUF2184 domain-containing protein [Pseudodesulfovibrio sp.]|uniref:DUF2184 domain-containing protein n=1 Tax=Pseudodesulfovibrio sp. TaxID=2035812 RepID=UPI00262E067F|nr:DUF2184 domain-containing protein [Pseudodesulfovibrio sp.]MDD3310959.1 DUF2184 domain-containing protein [Pseudodesulfovibrio sp.]